MTMADHDMQLKSRMVNEISIRLFTIISYNLLANGLAPPVRGFYFFP